MPMTKDCVDFTISLNMMTGISYNLVSKDQAEMRRRTERLRTILELKPAIEKKIMAEICYALGYDDQTLSVKLTERRVAREAAEVAEAEGRAAKQAVRDGLPQPSPPPAIGEVHPDDKEEM